MAKNIPDLQFDTSNLRQAVSDVQDAISNLATKLKALEDVDVPLKAGQMIQMADKPKPSYRAADIQASDM